MIFVLLTLIIMVVSVLLIRTLCRHFGIRVKLSSLFLCAALSALVTVFAIEATTVLDKYQYLRLAGLAFLAALIVTGFNEMQLRREDKTPAAWPSAPMPWEESVPEPDEPVEEERREEALQEEPAACDGQTERAAAPFGGTAPESPAPAEEEQDEPAEEAEMPHEPLVAPASKEAQEKIEAMESLDELLSYAYAQKVDDPSASIAAYRVAIDRYPDDDYAPFLIIELAGLYKEHAAYQEAIRIYTKALTLPSVAGNDTMQREFMKSLRYLGTVQDILSKHHASAMAFQDIPKALLDEIEVEFSQQGAGA